MTSLFADDDNAIEVEPGVTLTKLAYLDQVYDFRLGDRWYQVLYLCIYVVAFAGITVVLGKKIRHTVR